MSILTALYSAQNGQAQQNAIPTFIPTIFIGLGGSGKSVLMRLRKQFHERYSNWGPRFDRFARFVFIDTDKREFTPRDERDALYLDVFPLEWEVVESTITRASFSKLFDNLERRVESGHLHWLKPSMRTVGPGAVEDGAGTHRQFGRLAFFENYGAIKQQIQKQIEEVLDYATRHGTEVAPDRIEVVIVTSLAGGTGSGMFLDVAYLVRDLLSRPDYNALRIKHVTIVAFLPEMFREGKEDLLPRFRQNAYASLLELEYYGTPRTGDALFLGDLAAPGRDTRHGFRVSWPGRGEVFFPDRGWDTLFLVDNVNNLTAAAPMSDAEIFQMTADYLFLDFGQSRFASEKRTARSNLVQYKDRWKGTWVRRIPDQANPRMIRTGEENVFASQSGCIYSTFGLAEIFFDRDNLYQAAGYRLAAQLVRSRWIGAVGAYSDTTYQEWARNDLFYPAPRPGELPPPSFHPEAIAQQALVNAKKATSWLAELEIDFEQLNEMADEDAAEQLAMLIEKHKKRLNPGGEARMTIAENVARWTGTPTHLGTWRERLRALADEHLSEHGVLATIGAVGEYRKGLANARQKLASHPKANLSASLLSRLEEAKLVPFPVSRLALQIELKKAREAARGELRTHYHSIASTDSDPAVASATRYLGTGENRQDPGAGVNAHGTLYESLEKAAEQLGRIAERLDGRFLVSSQGRALINRRKQSLTVSWDSDRYDRKINEALVLYEPVGRDPKKPEGSTTAADRFAFDWVKLEQFVRDELRRNGKDGDANSVADLLRFWDKNRMVNDQLIQQIAQRLAEACEKVLRAGGLNLADVEHGNVADLLVNAKTEKEREAMLDQLVIAAAPYLPTLARPADGVQPANHNLFGLSVGGQPLSAQNADSVTDQVSTLAAARQPGRVADFGGRLEADQSSALFVRMMAGFPLQDYSRLEELYNAYRDPATNTRSNDECHIDFKQSWEDLPDIRAVGPDTYASVRENVEVVLLSMMTGVITYPKDKGAFYVRIPDPYGVGEDYHRLGKMISRSIKHACDAPVVREYLASRWREWENSPKTTTKHWACLYESALRTWTDSRREIEVEQGQTMTVPFRNCYGNLLRMIGKKLETAEGGRAWLEALRPPSPTEDGDDPAPSKPRPTGLAAALKPINDQLPIYQIIESKVAEISLPE